jgi:hypothetical protein
MSGPSRLQHVFAALLATAVVAPSPARSADSALPACLAGSPVPLLVKIGESTARPALLRGGIAPALEVIEADNSLPLWSASMSPPSSQQFGAMDAQFAGSLLPIDLDGDGVHDRIYAGDLAGRLWRFDLHHGQPARQWATGGVFADLSRGALRGFIAPPDVSLPVEGTTGTTWFNITIGTARIGAAAVANRFYVLHDHFPFEAWTQLRYDQWRPLRESDLVLLPRLGAVLAQPAPDGYYIETGAADFLSPTLTISGRATLALAEPSSMTGAGCLVAAVVSSIDLAIGAESLAAPSAGADGGPTRLAITMHAGEPFALVRNGNHAECMAGDVHVPSCDVDLSPRRTWWRREDAD